MNDPFYFNKNPYWAPQFSYERFDNYDYDNHYNANPDDDFHLHIFQKVFAFEFDSISVKLFGTSLQLKITLKVQPTKDAYRN